MRKYIVSIFAAIIICMCPLFVNAASPSLFLIIENNKYGYINSSGTIVIKPQFDVAFPFSEGLALVESNEKYGYINEKGVFVIKPQFLDAYDFCNGLARVSKNVVTNEYLGETQELYGYINNKGQQVIDYKFSKCGDFSNDLAWITKGVTFKFYDLIDKKGNYILKSDVAFKQDSNGKTQMILNSASEIYGANAFSEGLSCVNYKGKYGFIDKSCKLVISASYDKAYSFSEGLAAVSKNGKWGFINKTNKMIISAKYDNVGSFSENLAMVNVSGKYGYIDKKGSIIIKPQYSEAGYFSEGLALVKNSKSSYYIDKKGKIIIDVGKTVKGNEILGNFNNRLAAIVTNESGHYSYSYINKSGKYIYENKNVIIDPSQGFEKAQALQKSGKYQEALTIYEQIINQGDSWWEIDIYKATCLSNLGKTKEALAIFEKVTNSYSKDYNTNYGLCLYKEGKYEDALDKLNFAVRLGETDDNVYYTCALAACLLYTSDNEYNFNSIIQYLEEAISANSKNIERAKNDKVFDSIRNTDSFKYTIGEKTDDEETVDEEIVYEEGSDEELNDSTLEE